MQRKIEAKNLVLCCSSINFTEDNNTLKTRIMSLLKRLTFLLAIVFISSEAAAQLWKMRLVLEPDSLTFASDSARFEFDRATESYKFLSSDSLRPKFTQASFSVFYRQDNKRINFKPIENIYRKKMVDAQNEIYRLPSALYTESILAEENIFDEIIRQHTVDYPQSVNYTWSEVPETYKVKEISTDRYSQLRSIAQQLDKKRIYTTNMRTLPKKKESPWTISGENNAQFSQLFLSNWSTGGETSVTLSFDCRVNAVYKQEKYQWENSIVHKLGVTRTSTLGGRVSDDEFNLSSKYGYQAVSKWYYSASTTFKTQLFRSYSKSDTAKTTPKSAFLTPAYWKLIFGMDYKKDNLSVLISPYTLSITIVSDTTNVDKSNFGLEGNKKAQGESGFSVNTSWKKRLTTEITYTTTCELFYEYAAKNGTRQFDWENILDMQINRYLTTRLLFKLRYFNNESKKFQVKENFCIAFKFSF